MIYTFLGHKGKINYQLPYMLINPYGYKGSEFAPIVIHVHIYTLYLIQEREVRKLHRT